MSEVRETKLPGVGVRHEFDTESGTRVGVIVHRDGRREILVYDQHDPDACSTMVDLSAADTRTMSELLGSSQVTEAVSAVQQDIDALRRQEVPEEDESERLIRTDRFERRGRVIVEVLTQEAVR